MMMSCLLLASALSAGNAEFDRNAAESAARITMDRFVREMRENGLESGILSAEMLRDPGRFASSAAAEKECRVIYISKAEEAFARKCEDVRRSLSLDESFTFSLTDADKAALESKFPKVYKSERRDAVAGQAKQIVMATRPTEADIDGKSEDKLCREMTERIAKEQKTPVFEENLGYISEKIVAPVIKSAKAERKRQEEYLLSRARSDAIAPSRLERDLRERLAANVNDRAKDVGAMDAWGVFPSVLSKVLPAAVERRTINRLAACVNEVRLEVDVEGVAKVIAADPAAHVRYGASERVFSGLYGSEVLSNGLERALSIAPENERAEFRTYLMARLDQPDVVKSVERVVRRDIMPKWKAARAEVAAADAKKIWPNLDDGSWCPDPDLADETLSRSDYRRAIRDWRKISGLEELASRPGSRNVLEETARIADAGVAAAFELARSAIAAQNKIVDDSHDAVLAEAKSRKDSVLSKTPDLNAIVAMLTGAVEEKWAEKRIETLWPDGKKPSNAEEQHAELYPSVRKKIELLARKILEEMNIPEPQKENQETPEDSSQGESEDEKLEYTISVVKTSSGVEVKLLKGDAPVVERSVKAKFAPFDQAMREVSRKLGKELLSLP
ncbi:MAG: hypothetical protein J6V45_00465 [Kiritimatiellae bacterium]|nr:hypothetical protein [Kiritimatiellia bacterium]